MLKDSTPLVELYFAFPFKMDKPDFRFEGSLSVIANLPKTVVIALLERLHQRFRFDAIRRTLETVPGPELAAGQTAEAELMPFPVLDACLHLHASEKLTVRELAGILPGLFPDADPAVLAGQPSALAVEPFVAVPDPLSSSNPIRTASTSFDSSSRSCCR